MYIETIEQTKSADSMAALKSTVYGPEPAVASNGTTDASWSDETGNQCDYATVSHDSLGDTESNKCPTVETVVGPSPYWPVADKKSEEPGPSDDKTGSIWQAETVSNSETKVNTHVVPKGAGHPPNTKNWQAPAPSPVAELNTVETECQCAWSMCCDSLTVAQSAVKWQKSSPIGARGHCMATATDKKHE